MTGTTKHRDYYEVLGIPKDADQQQIEHAFRRLALKYHPDRSKEKDATAKFKEVSEAYAVLVDPAKRRQYDAHGFAGVSGYSHEDLFGGIDLNDILGGAGGFDFSSSLLDRMFGFGRKRGPSQGARIEVGLQVPLGRIVTGGEEKVHVHRAKKCSACDGSGTKPGTEPKPCENCGGSGQQTITREEQGAVYRQITMCPHCHGRGSFIDQPCPECLGHGRVKQEETLQVKIPPGIDEGRALRVPGHGHPSPDGGIPGDLYVFVSSQPDPRFERRGPHLLRTETIEIADAVLGTKLTIPTLAGEVEMQIPAGTQPETTMRLLGQGLPVYGRDERGSMYVVIHVHIPEQLDEQTRDLFQQLRELERPEGMQAQQKCPSNR